MKKNINNKKCMKCGKELTEKPRYSKLGSDDVYCWKCFKKS